MKVILIFLLAIFLVFIIFKSFFKRPKKEIEEEQDNLEPNIVVTEKCNANCIYCLARGEDRLMSPKRIEYIIKSGFQTLMFEGGEPLLFQGLEKLISNAVSAGVPNIIILTKGILLNDKRLNSLVKAGATHFHFNFPAHIKKEHELITGIPGMFERQIDAIGRTSKIKNAAVLVCVINKINYKFLPEYVRFVKANFPQIFYIEFNFIKVMGRVKDRHYLVPKLSSAAEYLKKAMSVAKELEIACLIDGFPLCLLEGLEAYTYDAAHLMQGDKTYAREKENVVVCNGCSLSSICSGPRKDYVSIYGLSELKPSAKDPQNIIQTIKNRGGQLALNKRHS